MEKHRLLHSLTALCVFAMVFMVMPVKVYAVVATPSNVVSGSSMVYNMTPEGLETDDTDTGEDAGEDDSDLTDQEEFELDDLDPDELDEDEEDEEYIETFDASVLVPYLEDINGLVADIHAEVVPSEVPDQGQYSVVSLDDGEISEFALAGDFGIDSNVVIYEGTWSGRSYRAVFPAEYEQYLIVTDEGYLYNLSGSSVTGRLFEDEVNYQDYEYSSLVLNSVLGNVASTIYNYGFPSYVRTYYVSSNRITSNDTYGLFRVSNIVRTDSADPVRIGNNYLLVLMMIGGMMLLCFMKRSHQ